MSECPAWGGTRSPVEMIAWPSSSFLPPPPLSPGGPQDRAGLLNQLVQSPPVGRRDAAAPADNTISDG